ncbi:MAG: heat-inducible transcription repressor HrcA [Candidatus Latescibacteria bacterium]|nr:heat-inducible transcription repressor HrcA [Candidatus Latescibacterota bacterium]
MSYQLRMEREKDILRCLVDSHVSTASPVGSQWIARRSVLGISPATIRNTMGELEEAGYISRPHASAGRIPTDKGYRYYVDTLIRPVPLSPTEKGRLRREVQGEWSSVQEVLDHTAHVLGIVCRELGVTLAPRLYAGLFQRLELIPVGDRKVLLVLMITSGLVRTIVAELDSDIPPPVLAETCRVLNERLSGCSLQEVKRHLDERLRDAPRAHPKVVQLFIRSTDHLFDFRENEQVHLGGTTQIVTQPEFVDHEKLSRLLEFLDQKQVLVQWLQSREHPDGVMVTIGHEHPRDEIHACSAVTSSYRIGGVVGIIGVIGPTRMPYARLMSIVGYTSQLLSTMFV